VNAVHLSRFLAPLALSLLCATARPASANVFVDLDAGKSVQGLFVDQIQVQTGETFFFRLAALNTSFIPLSTVCDIPALKVRVGNILVPFRIREVLFPGKITGMTFPAVCTRAGTFKVTVLLLFRNPFTGKVCEIADTVTLVCVDKVSGGDGKKDGALGGQQSGGQGGKKDGTGTLGGQQSGTTGGQQSGSMGGQQGGKKDDTGAAGGQTGGGTGSGYIF